MNFGTIMLGIFILALGIVLVVFSLKVYNFTGQIDFIESKVPGGTLSFIKLFGILLVLIGAALATGVFTWLTQPIVNSIAKTFQRQ